MRTLNDIEAELKDMRLYKKLPAKAAIAELEREIAAHEGTTISKSVTRSGAETDDPGSFEEALERLAKRSPSAKRTDLRERARKLWPKLFQEYQGAVQSEAKAARMPLDVRKSDAVIRFEKAVDDLQSKHRLSRFAALQRAAREMPREQFDAYRYALGDDE